MEEAIRKADVLIEALPYIKSFHKKIIVIKYGGSILGDEKIRKGVLEDIVFLSYMGLRPLLVHGGGPNISEKMRSVGKKTDFIDGMRVTDLQTLEIVKEELGNLNKIIVKEIEELGGAPISILPQEGDIILAAKKKAEIDLGFVGEVSSVDKEYFKIKLQKGLIPVVSPMGKGKGNDIYNINADEVASFLAAQLDAEKLVLLTNVKGIMRRTDEPNSFISTLNIAEALNLIDEKVVQEGMIPKVNACIHALTMGVKKTHMINACISHALLLEIFTDQGIGTEIVK